MKNFFSKFQESFSRFKIKRQLLILYISAIVIPVLIIGTFLIISMSNLLTNYHKDLLESDNLRVKTILFEITAQLYNVSEELSFDKNLQKILSGRYKIESPFLEDLEAFESSQSYMTNYTEIEDIRIYSNNPTINETGQLYHVDSEIEQMDWYKKAINQSGVFWVPFNRQDQYGNQYWNLCLVRKIPIVDSDYDAVLVIYLSDNYLKSRINNNAYGTSISIDDISVIYSSNRDEYGTEAFFPIDFEKKFYEYQGDLYVGKQKSMAKISTLNMYQSDSKIYICSYSTTAKEEINRIILICTLIIVLAIFFPGSMVYYFTNYFARRIDTLRGEIHRASNEEYNLVESIRGEDELSEAFEDLKIMIQKIKEKDARMYEAMINEQRLYTEQQVMEYKMLSSQINPHFLYNTLETIRMKAYTAGNREVATAIKLLGKSMRYVLDNTGSSSTTLKKELDYIDSYLQIQKLRFSERVNYKLTIKETVDVQRCLILPLLLQPIVENAIIHGLEEQEGVGFIHVNIYDDQEMLLHIDISDNGCGMTEEQLQITKSKIDTYDKNKSYHIGIYNTNQRIKLCYGQEYGIHIESVMNEGTTVKIVFPLELSEET